ncbi:MAG: hypothetical protein CEE41_04415 [Hadesarchaea archaeon B3_Hades]|nr:MAG: hypothetical protein CEE41_04415 [Hadesarchaea archaeon B3_Hades]
MTTHKKIRVSIEMRKVLKVIGRKGESYDAVIRRLVVSWMTWNAHPDSEVMKELLGMEEEVT